MTTVTATRRLENKRRAWEQRLAKARSRDDLVRIAYDRARAAVRLAERRGHPEAADQLAQVLCQWAQQWEEWEARGDTQ